MTCAIRTLHGPAMLVALTVACAVHLAVNVVAAPISPADIGGLSAWYQADNIVDGIEPADGSPVTSWFDSSGNGLTLLGGSPTLVASSATFGGMPTVSFDGSDDVLVTADGNTVTGQTVIMLADFSSLSNPESVVSGRDDFTLNFQRRDGTNLWRTGLDTTIDVYQSSGVPVVTGASAGSPFTIDLSSGANMVALAADGADTDEFQLAKERNNATFAPAEISEVLIYDTKLTAQQINDIGYYLQGKYSLATDFVDGIFLGDDFNADTIIDTDTTGHISSGGYRAADGRHEFFATEAGSAVLSGGDGVDGGTGDIPNDGTLAVGGYTFRFGPLTGTELNTILLDDSSSSSIPAAATVDINANEGLTEIAVLFGGIGLQDGSNDGTLTVSYASGDDDVLFWDLRDQGGFDDDGLALAASGDGLDFWRGASGAVLETDRNLYYQVFSIDSSRLVQSITFDVDGVGDPDADIGVYAVEVTVIPEPSSALLVIVSLLGLFAMRRRG